MKMATFKELHSELEQEISELKTKFAVSEVKREEQTNANEQLIRLVEECHSTID